MNRVFASGRFVSILLAMVNNSGCSPGSAP
jgi:hypothetical protein